MKRYWIFKCYLWSLNLLHFVIGEEWNQMVGPIRTTSGDCRAEMKKIFYPLFPFLKLLWPASITLATANSDVILHCLHPSIPVCREDVMLLGIHRAVLETCLPQELKPTIFYFYHLLCVWKRRKTQMPSIVREVFSMQSVKTSLGTHSLT